MKITLKDTSSLIFPELSGKSNSELFDYFQIQSDLLKQKWNDSNQTDFSIYKDPEYISEGFISFYKVSTMSIGKLKLWIKQHNINPVEHTLFEIYNGIGITTLHLVNLGFNVEFFNDNEDQLRVMETLFNYYQLPMPKNNPNWKEKKYDFVVSLEVIEHFKEPLIIAQDLVNCINDGGYYVEATGFGDSSYPGHFKEYIVDNELVDGRKAANKVATLLRQNNLKKILIGFQKKPRIWKKQKDKSIFVY